MSQPDAPPPAAPLAEPPESPAEQADRTRGLSPTLAFLVARQSWVVLTVAIVGALLIGALLIRIQGVNPWYAYGVLLDKSIGSGAALMRTLEKTTPLVLAGLAVVIPLRVGLFNIGGQGQVLMGALTAAWVGYLTRDSGLLSLPLAMLGGIIAGAFVGWIAGVLKATRGVHEVISTIMLNSIVQGVVEWLANGPLQAKDAYGVPKTEAVGPSARIGSVFGVPVGFIIAALIALGIGMMFRRTTLGFRFDTVGSNKFAAGYAGVNIGRIVMLSMIFAGGLAGLAGALEVQGVVGHFEPAIAGSIGFDGITIALLARSKPLATIPAALLLGIMRTGAGGLQFDTGIAPEIVDLLIAIILLLVSIPMLAKWIFRSRAHKIQASATSWGS